MQLRFHVPSPFQHFTVIHGSYAGRQEIRNTLLQDANGSSMKRALPNQLNRAMFLKMFLLVLLAPDKEI